MLYPRFNRLFRFMLLQDSEQLPNDWAEGIFDLCQQCTAGSAKWYTGVQTSVRLGEMELS